MTVCTVVDSFLQDYKYHVKIRFEDGTTSILKVSNIDNSMLFVVSSKLNTSHLIDIKEAIKSIFYLNVECQNGPMIQLYSGFVPQVSSNNSVERRSFHSLKMKCESMDDFSKLRSKFIGKYNFQKLEKLYSILATLPSKFPRFEMLPIDSINSAIDASTNMFLESAPIEYIYANKSASISDLVTKQLFLLPLDVQIDQSIILNYELNIQFYKWIDIDFDYSPTATEIDAKILKNARPMSTKQSLPIIRIGAFDIETYCSERSSFSNARKGDVSFLASLVVTEFHDGKYFLMKRILLHKANFEFDDLAQKKVKELVNNDRDEQYEFHKIPETSTTLHELLTFIDKERLDIISGWNIHGFDYNFLKTEHDMAAESPSNRLSMLPFNIHYGLWMKCLSIISSKVKSKYPDLFPFDIKNPENSQIYRGFSTTKSEMSFFHSLLTMNRFIDNDKNHIHADELNKKYSQLKSFVETTGSKFATIGMNLDHRFQSTSFSHIPIDEETLIRSSVVGTYSERLKRVKHTHAHLDDEYGWLQSSLKNACVSLQEFTSQKKNFDNSSNSNNDYFYKFSNYKPLSDDKSQLFWWGFQNLPLENSDDPIIQQKKRWNKFYYEFRGAIVRDHESLDKVLKSFQPNERKYLSDWVFLTFGYNIANVLGFVGNSKFVNASQSLCDTGTRFVLSNFLKYGYSFSNKGVLLNPSYHSIDLLDIFKTGKFARPTASLKLKNVSNAVLGDSSLDISFNADNENQSKEGDENEEDDEEEDDFENQDSEKTVATGAKMDVGVDEIFQAYVDACILNKKSHNMALISSYCSVDSSTVLDIIAKYQALTTWTEYCRIFNTTIGMIGNGGQQKKMTNLVYYRIRDTGLFFNHINPAIKWVLDQNNRDLGYMGAYVFPPSIGRYDEIVVTFDFSSLYPSTMTANNLSPDTAILSPLCYKLFLKHCLKDGIDNLNVSSTNHIIPMELKGRTLPSVESEFVTHISSIIPSLAIYLVNQRALVRKQLANETDENIKSILDAKQSAIKCLNNSIYGMMGASRELTPFSFQRVAAATTKCGRHMILEVAKVVETEYDKYQNVVQFTEKNHPRVIYGDTDSVMVAMGSSVTVDMVSNIANSLANYITNQIHMGKLGNLTTPSNKTINNNRYLELRPNANQEFNILNINFECYATPYILYKKKKYLSLKTIGNKPTKPDRKGLTKSDALPFTTRVLEQIYHEFLYTKNLKEADTNLQLILQEALLTIANGEVPRMEQVMQKKYDVSKSSKSDSKLPPHYCAANKHILRTNEEITNGSSIPHIICEPSNITEMNDKKLGIGHFAEHLDYCISSNLAYHRTYYLDHFGKEISRTIVFCGTDLINSFQRMLKNAMEYTKKELISRIHLKERTSLNNFLNLSIVEKLTLQELLQDKKSIVSKRKQDLNSNSNSKKVKVAISPKTDISQFFKLYN